MYQALTYIFILASLVVQDQCHPHDCNFANSVTGAPEPCSFMDPLSTSTCDTDGSSATANVNCWNINSGTTDTANTGPSRAAPDRRQRNYTAIYKETDFNTGGNSLALEAADALKLSDGVTSADISHCANENAKQLVLDLGGTFNVYSVNVAILNSRHVKIYVMDDIAEYPTSSQLCYSGTIQPAFTGYPCQTQPLSGRYVAIVADDTNADHKYCEVQVLAADIYYAFFDGSNLPGNSVGDLCFTQQSAPTGDLCLSFYYSMHGSDIGTLEVLLEFDVSGTEDTRKTRVFEQSGPMSLPWKHVGINLDPTDPFKVVVRATSTEHNGNTTFEGDIAVDAFKFYQTSCETVNAMKMNKFTIVEDDLEDLGLSKKACAT